MRRTRVVALAASAALLAGLGGVAVISQSATAAPNPVIDPGNGHSYLGTKPLPHPSGGTEVSYDERAQAADLQSSVGSDTPPDATASALGCANRGSATNPRVNQDCTLRRQAEEQIRINPTDPTNVVAGQNDSRVGFNKCGFDYSLDSGATWGDGLPPFYQHLSQIGHTYDAGSDPALAFDGSGRAWFSCVVFDINTNASGLFAVPSTPGLKGSAYSNVGAGASKYVVAEDASGSNFYDKEFLAGDPHSSAVYVTFTDFQSAPNCKRAANKGGQCQSPIMISKWTGTGWTTPIQISGQAPFCVGGDAFNPQLPADSCNQDQGSFPVVLPNGDVFVVFSNFNTPALVNQQLGVHVQVLSDNTLKADPPVRVGLDNENGAALCDFGRGPEQCVDSLNVRSDDFPALAVDPTNGAHLVATWTDTRDAPAAGSGKYDIVVSESTNGGLTWTDGIGSGGGGSVLTTSGAYFEPSVTVTASSHKTVVSAYRADSAKHTGAVGDGTFGYGYFVSPVSGSTGYLPASDSQTNPSPQANAAQRGFLGDYSSIGADSVGGVYMTWSDTRNHSAAGPDEDVFVFKTTP